MYTCKDCGKDFEKLYAPKKGQCRRCYKNEWERNARKDPVLGANLRKRAMRTYKNNKDVAKAGMKKYRERIHFEGKRQAILDKFNRTCVRCESRPEEKNLVVHHEDRNGRGKDRPNNEDDNLILLCRSCHAKEHQQELIEARRRKRMKIESSPT